MLYILWEDILFTQFRSEGSSAPQQQREYLLLCSLQHKQPAQKNRGCERMINLERTCIVCGVPITTTDLRVKRCELHRKPNVRKGWTRREMLRGSCGAVIPIGSRRNKYCSQDCRQRAVREADKQRRECERKLTAVGMYKTKLLEWVRQQSKQCKTYLDDSHIREVRLHLDCWNLLTEMIEAGDFDE